MGRSSEPIVANQCRVAAMSASPASRGTPLFIDTRKGSVLHRVEVSAEPVDVAVR